MAWTNEQQQAIDLEGTNILVSAGAGSGKTAVLTERVKRKVLNGTSVKRLLVLTFTNAAAAEMKDRIRKALQKTEGLEEEANLVDSSYITTFDSFALSMVKKYHTELNIPKDVEITDEVLIQLKKQEILEEIFDCYYEKPSDEFLKLINDFCLKDDKELKDAILSVYSKIELKYDKSDFLKNYCDIFTDEKIDSFVDEYIDFLRSKQKVIKDLFNDLVNYFDDEFINVMRDNYGKFLDATTYDDFINSMDFQTVRVPRGSSEEGKAIKEQIVSLVKEFRDNYLLYSSIDEVRDELDSTKDSVKVIIEILQQFDSILDHYKHKNHIYTFNDIARMAIEVVDKNIEIQDELRNSFDEIMVDEYQDTSDIQEKFISLIARNNVYMVGDIKQSIYRFRNANPDIFRNKYNLYRDTDLGIKIDLLKNFRSRREVLDDINTLFNPVMDEKIGGAAYPESHQMVFGNTLYEELGKTEQNYHMNIITYNSKELGRISKSEEEAYIIANDIKNKINNKYKIFDKDKKELHDARYSDFVILLDKSRDFDLYKKVFEYFQIPLQILKDESFQKDDDSAIFKNLLKLLVCIKKNDINKEFEYNFVSISRSYLYKISDEEIYNYFINKNYSDSKLYKDLLELSLLIDQVSLSELIREVFNKVDYDNKILNTSNIHSKRVREEFFYNLAVSSEKQGNTIYDFVEYLDKIFENDLDLTFNMSSKNTNSCRIMTIHKSKGLEFPICYFAGYSSTFNLMELKERIIFDNYYGLIIPKVDNYYKDTILKTLLKSRVRLEEISEKIRLFYVATTRAKEEMIFILPEDDEDIVDSDVVPDYIREKYNSFGSIMKSIKSILNPYINKTDIMANKDYLSIVNTKELEVLNNDNYDVYECNIEKEEVLEKHYSKDSLHIATKEEKEVMEFGTKVHEILEQLDFSNPVLLDSINDNRIKNKILKFLNSDLIKDKINNQMYKEYEFYYMDEDSLNHGIIDLLIDNNDSYTIIDYKLKNIDDENYNKQLNGYRSYIEKKTNKKCACYLYSIIDEDYREVLYED